MVSWDSRLIIYCFRSNQIIKYARYPPVGSDHILAILRERYPIMKYGAGYLDVGDCTAHHGWVFHGVHKQPEDSGER